MNSIWLADARSRLGFAEEEYVKALDFEMRTRLRILQTKFFPTKTVGLESTYAVSHVTIDGENARRMRVDEGRKDLGLAEAVALEDWYDDQIEDDCRYRIDDIELEATQ